MGSLNHSYRLVWNELCGAFVAVPEFARGRGKRTGGTVRRAIAAAIAAAAAGSFAGPAAALDAGALPTGGQITAGNASLTQQGSQLRIDQTSNKLILNWNSFDIGSNASVRFNQTGADAVALNRVTGGAPSQIFGDLSANGQVWLVNNSGVVFGKGATVNVGGLVASTLNVSDADFLGGRARFSGTSTAQVRNDGSIRADGVVALLGASVVNTGTISAGQVAMAAGQQVALDFNGDGLLQVRVDQAALDAELSQEGLVQGRQVVLSAPSASALRASVINMDGVVEAKGLSEQGGRIILDGGDNGQVNVTGRLDASSAQGLGGDVRVTGGTIALRGATVDASGGTGGGQIHIGGGWQGKDASLTNADKVSVDAATTLRANATVNGNGGEVVTWSDGRTDFAGRVESRGGDQGGNGGRIEVSGKQELAYSGRADARAAKGATGDLLLDPASLTINGGGSGTDVLTGSVVYEKDIEAQQANVLLQATGDILVNDLNLNGGDGKITMQPNVSLRIEAGTSSGTHLTPPSNLTDGAFTSNFDLMFANASNVLEVSGSGSLMLVAGATGSGRVLNAPTMIAHGAGTNPSGALPAHNVSVPGSGTPGAGSITIYGADGATVGGSLTTNGGYVRIWADSDNGGAGFFTLNAPVSTNGGNLYVSTGSGDVTLNSSMVLGAGRIFFRADGSYTNGNKILAGLLSVNGDVNIDTPFVFKGGASIYTDSSINFGNVNVNMDTGTGVLTLRANRIDWGTSTLQNLSTASLRLEPYNPATNMVLGDANGFASATTLAKLPGIKNLTIGRADGTGTISVPGNFSFNASGSFEMVDRTIDVTAGTLNNTTGNIVLTGDNVNLSQSITAKNGTGKVTIRQMTVANELHLGGGLSNASIGQVNAATLEVGRSDGGNLVFDNDITTNATTVSLKSGGQVIGVNGGVAAANVAVTAGQGATLTDDTFSFTKLALDVGGTTVVNPASAAGFTLGTVDGVAGLTTRGAADVTLNSGTGTLALDAPINFTGGAAKLTLQAPSWSSTANQVTTNGAQATVVFDRTGPATGITVGGTTTADLTNTMLARFNGVNTLRVDASDLDLGVVGPVQLSLGNRLELLGGTFAQAGAITMTNGGVLVRAEAGGINVANNISSSGTVSLDDRSTVGIGNQQGVLITAGKLALRSGGDASFSSAQQVGTVAADVHALSMSNTGSLIVGTADGLQGVQADGTVALRAQGAAADLTLQQQIVAGNDGSAATPVVLRAGRNFINQAGASALQAGNGGAWQVYSTSPLSDTRGGLVASFKQYDTSYGNTVQGAGDGFLYTVAPTLTVGLSGSASKVYDGNVDAATGGLVLGATGGIDGDVVNLAIGSSGSAHYDTKNVGSGKTVTVDGVVIAGGQNGGTAVYGYRLVSDSASAAIGQVTPKTVTVANGAVQDKVYDGNTTAQLSAGGIAGLVSGDDTALSGAVSFLDKNAGVGKAVNVSGLVLTGNDAGNYVLDTSAGATASITPKTVGVGAIQVSGKVYDGTRDAQVTTGGLTGAVSGDQLDVTVSGQFDTKNVGNGKAVDVQLALTGADAGNYVLASSSAQGSASITAKTVDVVAVQVSGKVYDGTRSAQVTTGGAVGVIAGDELGVSANGQFDTKNVGAGKAVDVQFALTGSDAGNYVLSSSSAQGAASITVKSVDVVAIQVGGKVYDGTRAAQVTTGGAVGVIAGDELGVAASGQFDTKNVGTGKAVDVQLALTGADAGNYVLASGSAQGSASITAKTVDVGAIQVGGKVYDGTRAAQVTTGGAVGVIAGDELGVAASGQFDTKNVGTGKAVDVQLALTGSDAGNYVLASSSTQGSASITAKTVDVGAIQVGTKVYDGTRTAQVTTGGAVGVVAGDQLGVAASGQFDNKNAGTGKAVDVQLALTGADAGNYVLSTGSAQSLGDVTARTIQAPTVTVVTGVFNSDTSATLVIGSPQGIVAGDQVSVGGTGRFDTPFVGSDKPVNVQLTLTGADAANYRLENSSPAVTGTVNPQIVPAAIGALVIQPVAGNATQDSGGSKTSNVPTGNGGTGGGLGNSVAVVAAGPSGNPAGTIEVGNGAGGGNGGNAGNGASNGAGNGNGATAGAGNANGGSASGDGAGAGQNANGTGGNVAVANVGLEQMLRDSGQISLAVDAPAYGQPLQSQLPVYTDNGSAAPTPLGMFRVDDLGDSLALKPVQQPVPAADASSGGVTRQLRAVVALGDERSATLDVVLVADGTLRVNAPAAASDLDDDLVTTLALSALKQQTGVAPTSVRAVMLRRGS
ncbi:YDG domain-containing protein [Roseateles chitinivorans]|uniref:YDG domain-containing protein n=1 Tax=Roseateles chitinivorans TaxID=2917965 RepID=UPI003D66CB59